MTRITGARVRVPLAPIVNRSKASNLHTALITMVDRWSQRDRDAYARVATYAGRLAVKPGAVSRAFTALTAMGVLHTDTAWIRGRRYSLRSRRRDVIPFVDTTVEAADTVMGLLGRTMGYGPWRAYLLLVHQTGRRPYWAGSRAELAALLAVSPATATEWLAALVNAGILITWAQPGVGTVYAPLRRRVADLDERAELAAALRRLSTSSNQPVSTGGGQVLSTGGLVLMRSIETAQRTTTADSDTAPGDAAASGASAYRAAGNTPGSPPGRRNGSDIGTSRPPVNLARSWCGRCDLNTRLAFDDHGRRTLIPCPACANAKEAVVGAVDARKPVPVSDPTRPGLFAAHAQRGPLVRCRPVASPPRQRQATAS